MPRRTRTACARFCRRWTPEGGLSTARAAAAPGSAQMASEAAIRRARSPRLNLRRPSVSGCPNGRCNRAGNALSFLASCAGNDANGNPPVARGVLFPYGWQGRNATTGRYSRRATVKFRQAVLFLPPPARAEAGSESVVPPKPSALQACALSACKKPRRRCSYA